jgi:hypothetical protein
MKLKLIKLLCISLNQEEVEELRHYLLLIWKEAPRA